MKNSWNKVVALMLAAALCVSCGVTGFAEDTQTDENTEIVEVVEQQTQEEPPKEEAPEPVKEPEPAPAPEPVKEPEPAPAPVKEEPKAEPAPAPKEEPKAEPAPEAPKEEPKEEPAPEAPKAEEPKKEEPKAEAPEQKIEEPAEQKTEDIQADETKKEEEIKAEEPKAEESQTEEPKPEEKPVEQPTVPVTKVEQPAEEAPAADEVKKENITVHIEWEDEDNALGLRPTTLAVTLSGSDGQTYSAKIAEKDGWQHTFADLTTQRGAEVIYYSVDADDVTDYDKDVRGLTVTYTCTAQPVVDDENLIDDQMDGDPAELPEGDIPTVTETEDGTVIDMGETAEAPVEGEDANADKPEEDGELDEDFTLPEEGELPEEDAEPEIPEIDFSTLSVAISAESDVVELGGDMVLTAILTGFEDLNYTLQWQFSTDNANWANVDGATGSTLRVQMNEENRDYFWRVSVDNISWKNPPVVQTEQPLDVADTAETGAQE